MTRRLRTLAGACTLLIVVMLVASVRFSGQQRFPVVASNAVPPGLGVQIVPVRDVRQDACYLLFVVTLPAERQPEAPLPDIQSAAAFRDRRLAELAAAYEQNLGTVAAGIRSSDTLRYQWEAQNVQSYYDHVVREYELARLQHQLDMTSATPRIAVSGPVRCDDRAVSGVPPR
jgi:hypothetical protein